METTACLSLAAPTYTVRRSLTVCAAETFSLELSECGSNGTEPSRGSHCGLFTKNNRTRFAVTPGYEDVLPGN